MKKIIAIFIIASLVVLVVIAALATGVVLIRRANSNYSQPVVEISAPAYNSSFSTGQPVVFQAVARDPDGISRIEFWLDDKLIKQEESPWEKGITPLPLSHSVRFDQPGKHTFIARAVDSLGNTGQSSQFIKVEASQGEVKAGTYYVKEGDTLEQLAEAMGVEPEAISNENPGMGTGLPPAGTGISLPLPDVETEEDGLGLEEPPVPLLPIPDLHWAPPEINPRWMLPGIDFSNVFDGSIIESVPAGLLNLASLEVDADYDAVFCYVSAGDSPVIRIPGSGSLAHLSGRFWDIGEWFSGERMLPFLSSTGVLRLRMNCTGFYETTGGGIAYDLGTLDEVRSISETGTGLVDARTPGDSFWFHVTFRVQPLDTGTDIGGSEFDYLYLDSSRYERDAEPLVPDPHVLLEFRLYDEGAHVAPPIMDGFLIYRNDSLWRLTGPNTERYVVWDHLLEAGGCGQQTEFFVVGYRGNPMTPSETIESNRILINGYCPINAQFKHVTIQFHWLMVNCVEHLDHLGTVIPGIGPSCNDPGMPPCTIEDALTNIGCSSALDNFSPVSYGSINVNGRAVIDFPSIIQFSPNTYDLHAPPWDDDYIYTLDLAPGESLTVNTSLWDYDVFFYDDPLLPGGYTHSPEALDYLAANSEDEMRVVMLGDGYSWGSMVYSLTVEPFYAPPPTIVP